MQSVFSEITCHENFDPKQLNMDLDNTSIETQAKRMMIRYSEYLAGNMGKDPKPMFFSEIFNALKGNCNIIPDLDMLSKESKQKLENAFYQYSALMGILTVGIDNELGKPFAQPNFTTSFILDNILIRIRNVLEKDKTAFDEYSNMLPTFNWEYAYILIQKYDSPKYKFMGTLPEISILNNKQRNFIAQYIHAVYLKIQSEESKKFLSPGIKRDTSFNFAMDTKL